MINLVFKKWYIFAIAILTIGISTTFLIQNKTDLNIGGVEKASASALDEYMNSDEADLDVEKASASALDEYMNSEEADLDLAIKKQNMLDSIVVKVLGEKTKNGKKRIIPHNGYSYSTVYLSTDFYIESEETLDLTIDKAILQAFEIYKECSKNKALIKDTILVDVDLHFTDSELKNYAVDIGLMSFNLDYYDWDNLSFEDFDSLISFKFKKKDK